jgi:hypothetical protein
MGQGRGQGIGNYQIYLEMIGRSEFPDPETSTYSDGDCSFASVRQSWDFSIPTVYLNLKSSKQIAENLMLVMREEVQGQIQRRPILWQYLQNTLSSYLSAIRGGFDDDEDDPQTAEDILKLIGKPFADGMFT